MKRRELLASIGTASLVGLLPNPAGAQSGGSSEELLRRYVEGFWNTGDVTILDEILHPDITVPFDDTALPGRDAYKQRALLSLQNRQQYPDATYRLDRVIGDNEQAAGVVIWSFVINIKPPAEIPIIIFTTIQDGLIAEWVAVVDTYAFNQYMMP